MFWSTQWAYLVSMMLPPLSHVHLLLSWLPIGTFLALLVSALGSMKFQLQVPETYPEKKKSLNFDSQSIRSIGNSISRSWKMFDSKQSSEQPIRDKPKIPEQLMTSPWWLCFNPCLCDWLKDEPKKGSADRQFGFSHLVSTRSGWMFKRKEAP